MAIRAYELSVSVGVEGDAKAVRKLKDVDDAIDKLSKRSLLGSLEGGLKSLTTSTEKHLKPIKGITDGWDNFTTALNPATQLIGSAASVLAIGTGAIVGFGAALFALTKITSDFGSEISDMSDKTGLSAETLSALDHAANISGASIENLATSVSFFSRTLADAADGSSTARDALIKAGLDPAKAWLDLEGSLRLAFKAIQNIENPTRKAQLATALFSRSGRELIPIISTVNGNIDEAIERAKTLGFLWTGAAAAAADKFGDDLDTLKTQVKNLGFAFGKELLPVLNDVTNEMSQFFIQNQKDIQGWAYTTRKTVQAVIDAFKELWETASAARFGEKLGAGLGGIMSGEDVERDKSLKVLEESLAIFERGLKQAAILNQQQNLEDARLSGEKVRTLEGEVKSLQDIRDEALKRLKDNLKESGIVNQQYLDDFNAKAKDAYDHEAWLINQKTQLRVADSQSAQESQQIEIQRQQQLQELYKRTIKINQSILEENNRKAQEAKTLLGAWLSEQATAIKIQRGEINEYQSQIDEVIAKLKGLGFKPEAEQLTTMKLLVGHRAINDLLAEQKNKLDDIFGVQVSQVDIVQEQIKKIEATGVSIDDVSKKHLLTLATANDLLGQWTEIEKKVESVAGYMSFPELDTSGIQGTNTGVVVPDDDNPPAVQVNDLADALYGNFGQAARVANVLADSLSFTFQTLANAVGQAVHAFVLFGSSGTSFRKFAAEVIGSIAQMAVVQSIWETAQGLAMLALSWFLPNPKYIASAKTHFAAAATYGIIGGVAAGIGRSIAGSAFSGGGGGADSGAAQNTGGGETTITRNTGVRSLFNESRSSSGGRDDTLLRELAALRQSNQEMRVAFLTFADSMNTFETAQPGDILQKGVRQNRGFITETVHDELSTNHTLVEKMTRRLLNP